MFEARLKNIRQKLIKEKLDGLFISSVSNITYLTGYGNFSSIEREAYLLIGHDFQYIITDGRYSEAIKEQVSHFQLFERGHKNKTEDLLKSLKNKVSSLGFEEDNLTVSEYKLIKKHFKKLKHFEVNKLRSIKSSDEIKKIEDSAKLGDLAFEYILKKIKVGVSEKEIAWNLEHFIKQQGADLSFPPIVAFGKNSSIPHHQTGDKRLTINDKLILLDFGTKINNYCSDMTRTVFFGEPSEKQQEIYKTVLTAQQKAVDFVNKQIKSGKEIKASQVDKIARDYIKSQGFPNIPHSLGHGIGLEVHEHPSLSPKSKQYLKQGMVFSIEPGIYLPAARLPAGQGRQGIPDFGGVRIEDLFVYGKDQLRQITTSPKNLIKI